MKQKSLVILFALCVMLSSCFEDKRTYMETQLPPVEQTDTSDKEKGEIDTQKTDSPEMQTDTVDREKGITDSLKTDTTKAIAKDTMKAEDVNSAKAVTKEGGLPTFWEVLSLGFSGLALVLCIVIWHQIGRFGKDVSHELRVVEQDCHRLNSKNTMMGSRFDKIEKNCSDMRNNIDSLSEKIRKMESTEMSTRNTTHEKRNELEESKEDQKQPIKRGYFGIVKVGSGIAMFNDYPKSRNEGAYFEVEYLDDNHCEFAPIELDRIRSIDAVNEAVEYNGDIAYANSMEVITKGKAVLDKGHGFWKITDKANIKLKN